MSSELHNATDAIAGVHQIEGVVDVVQRHLVGNQIVDIDLAVHIPVYDPRHVCATLCASEGRAAPYPAGDQLERPGRDFLENISVTKSLFRGKNFSGNEL